MTTDSDFYTACGSLLRARETWGLIRVRDNRLVTIRKNTVVMLISIRGPNQYKSFLTVTFCHNNEFLDVDYSKKLLPIHWEILSSSAHRAGITEFPIDL